MKIDVLLIVRYKMENYKYGEEQKNQKKQNRRLAGEIERRNLQLVELEQKFSDLQTSYRQLVQESELKDNRLLELDEMKLASEIVRERLSKFEDLHKQTTAIVRQLTIENALAHSNCTNGNVCALSSLLFMFHFFQSCYFMY